MNQPQSIKAIAQRRIVDAARNSVWGLKACFQHEEAFRIESLLSLILVPLAFLVAADHLELLLLLASIFLVLIVELLNSAVEATVDRIGSERHELAGRAKDLGSAAVFLSMMLFLLVWGVICF